MAVETGEDRPQFLLVPFNRWLEVQWIKEHMVVVEIVIVGANIYVLAWR
ncbi:hypothetical protein PCL1606_42620 [Pseudomonas chlororaphis]|uniref:Uncharacterized protein n=1 Tax=Pseudomonas chlororaphis TaxID=587753 RepID=A0A0D5Y404_9PSED|nr:hypothetical protein PCL1606_42620 [Pseudomonas chlororaphis]